MEYAKATPISLKTHPLFNEKWLQGVIADDPSILGLGDLTVKDVERRQPRAGRLDMLLTDPETNTRYEVEIQLGPTDESHIIRTIEYWDIEKTRYPGYDHVAVIVAEDITSRFLNVISLLNRAVPLIAIQIRAIEVNGVLTVMATTVLDLFTTVADDEDEAGTPTDRSYWIERGSADSVSLADRMLALINEVQPGLALKYNKHYIGLAKNGLPDNFLQFRPRKEHLIVEFRIPRGDETTALLESTGLDRLAYDKRWGRYRARVSGQDIEDNRDALIELIRRASNTAYTEAIE